MTRPVRTEAGVVDPTRRRILAGSAGCVAVIAGAGAARAQETNGTTADFLFVQTADAMAFDADRNRLTLRDVGTTTLFFSDRPERIAGNMTTAAFVPFWSEGKDSFLSDNPNADLSILENGALKQVVVEFERSGARRGRSPLYGEDRLRRDAGSGRKRLGLHRRDRHAADPPLRRGRAPSHVPSRGALLKRGFSTLGRHPSGPRFSRPLLKPRN